MASSYEICIFPIPLHSLIFYVINGHFNIAKIKTNEKNLYEKRLPEEGKSFSTVLPSLETFNTLDLEKVPGLHTFKNPPVAPFHCSAVRLHE